MSSKHAKLRERKSWHENGQPKEHAFFRDDGRIEGDYRAWHENGQLRIHEFWEDGFPEGECKNWYRDGRLMMREFYTRGIRNGKNYIWSGNGVLIRRNNYRDGELEGLAVEQGISYHRTLLYRKGVVIDGNFTENKKRAFLQVRKFLQNRASHNPDQILILDLVKLT
jgi:antitoxin component YwqK of YwqJK toxin-antitoxin module